MLGRWLGVALAVPSLVVVGLVAGSLLTSSGRSGALAVAGRAAGRPQAPASVDGPLLVREAGQTVLDAQVGVGRAATPTPSGLYYIAELLGRPNPHGVYGPW